MLRQVLVSEQIGRVTNARLVRPHAAGLGPRGLHARADRAVDRARGAWGEARVLRDHGGARARTSTRSSRRRRGRRRLRPARHEDARDLVQHGRLDLPQRSSPEVSTRGSTRSSSSTRTRPACGSCGATLLHTYPDTHALLEFDDVRVPAANLVGAEGDGMSFTHEWFRYERLMIAARCCGAMERLIDEATAFAKRRVQFGQPIVEFRPIGHILADSLTDLWASTHDLRARPGDRCGGRRQDPARAVLDGQAHTSEAAGRVADRAVQIFGGRGYMRENVAERFFRELRVDRIWEGTSEISGPSWPTSAGQAGLELLGSSG